MVESGHAGTAQHGCSYHLNNTSVITDPMRVTLNLMLRYAMSSKSSNFAVSIQFAMSRNHVRLIIRSRSECVPMRSEGLCPAPLVHAATCDSNMLSLVVAFRTARSMSSSVGWLAPRWGGWQTALCCGQSPSGQTIIIIMLSGTSQDYYYLINLIILL